MRKPTKAEIDELMDWLDGYTPLAVTGDADDIAYALEHNNRVAHDRERMARYYRANPRQFWESCATKEYPKDVYPEQYAQLLKEYLER